MTLRLRILSGFAIVMLLVVVLGVVVVAAQRGRLLDQLDRQLEAIVPLDRPVPPTAGTQPPPAPRAPVDEPISDIFLAIVRDDGVEVLVQGQLLDSVPELGGLIEVPPATRTFQTVDAAQGSTNFRVLVDPTAGGGRATTVIALPTTEVDETVRNLAITFALVGLLIAATLGVVAWWIVRLGLRPISAITETARAVSRGERGERAPRIETATEAGQLAEAFNLMLDQRDEAEDTLRRFASDASHELRTPLTSLRGYLDLYESGGFREPGRLDDAIRRMQGETTRMSGLVEQLLQLARLDEARDLERSPVDVGRLVGDVVENARAAHQDRTIRMTSPDDGIVEVFADRDHLQQLVTILVENALTHAPNATVDVRVDTTPERLTIVVADDGPGLEPEDADRVFDRFYRSESSRSRARGGSGLGLAIAHSIAAAHGGTLILDTTPGAGCEFTAEIPLLRSPD